MTVPAGPKIRFMADGALLDEIEKVLVASEAPVLRREVVEDPGRLAFDLDTVESLVTIATALVIQDPVIPTIWRWLRAERSAALVIEGPFGRVELKGDRELTLIDVQDASLTVVTRKRPT